MLEKRTTLVSRCVLAFLFVVIIISLAFSQASSEKIVRIYVEPLPEDADHAKNAVYYATKFWEKRDSIRFYKVSQNEQHDIMIKWIKESSNFQDEAGFYYNGLVSIALGDSSCSGIWQPYSSDMITITLEHEIGHYLGYGHSSDPNDVMYHSILTQYKEGTICSIQELIQYKGNELYWIIGPLLAIIGLGCMIAIHMKGNRSDHWRP